VYKSFFDLKKNPFNVNPDPAYLYLTPQMRQALDELTYGIETRKGLMLLTGEAGTGKTTLINHLLSWLGHQRARTAFIFNSHLDCNQLFDFILADFEISPTPQAKTNPLLAFNEWLLARYRAHDLVVLIVDEAQGLPVPVLEEIRLLLNMETPKEKLLQIVLVGQPELETKLKRPDLRQLHQRIALRCKTSPLTLQETYSYIEDRLHTAGSRSDSVFMSEAVEAIYTYSRGIPRIINLLCENALINAYVDQRRPIPPGIVDEAACELQFDEYRPVAPRLRTINQSADAPDLHSILAKIQADADHAWSDTNRVSPYLVNSQKSGVNNQPAVFALSEGEKDDREHLKIPDGADLRASNTSDSHVNITGLQPSNFAKFFPANLAAFRALSQSFDLRSKIESVRGAIGAFRDSKMTGFTNRIRNASGPVLVRLSEGFGPGVRACAAAVRNSVGAGAASAKQWWVHNFSEEMYGKSFVASAAISALLYLMARRMNPAQGWQHPGQMIIGFAGFLLCAVSVALGVTILVQARQKLLADGSEMVANALRWLRAPINPMQIRELDSIAGKIHTQRRA
jgi:general secretion pathway protein A